MEFHKVFFWQDKFIRKFIEILFGVINLQIN